MQHYKLLYLLAVMWWPPALMAQTATSNPVIYSLTEQDGLSDNNVTCFFQDSKGFMWIGTVDGLNRYDGSVFTVYRAGDNTAQGLANNHVNAITEDSLHHLWIGTDAGLSMYDPVTDTIHSWKANESINNLNLLKNVLVDKNGDVWAATYNGLLFFDVKQHSFTVYNNVTVPSGSQKGRNNRINKLFIDQQQRFWLCTFSGLWRFFPADGHFEQYISDKDVPWSDALLNDILQDRNGYLWLAFYEGKVRLFDPDKRSLSDYFPGTDNAGGVNISESKNIQGNEVLNSGVMEYDPGKKTSRQLYASAAPLSAAIAYRSRDNLLWWGTTKGIMIMDPAKQFFHHYLLSGESITHQGISMLPSKNGIYIGGAGEHFLKLYDDNFRVLKNIPYPKALGNAQPALLNIVRENDHTIWLCTESGMILYDERNGASKIFHTKQGDTSRPAKDFMSNLFIDSKGNHWLFPWRSGIWQIDKQTGSFKKMCTGFITENNELKKLLVANAVEDDTGNIWFADLDEGLIQYNVQTNTFTKPAVKQLGERYTLANLVLEQSWIWGVVSGRIFRIHTGTMEFQSWKIPAEFNLNVYSFCADQTGHLWILTRKGLLSFDKTSYHFKRYTANDGLLDNTLSGSIWPLSNGKIVYTGNNYVTVFNPGELIQSGTVPPVLLTTVHSQNKTLQVKLKSNGEKFIDLDYSYNNFTFGWAVQNYSNPLQNQYYYKLDGVDDTWKYAGNKGQAQYASLSPGRYTFYMRGASSDGVMNEKGDYLLIVIHPPFWRSWWFIALCIIGTGAVIYAVYRYRLNEALRLEKLRSRISTDLHDDIGSTLSSISILSDMALREGNRQVSSGMMQEIKDNSVLLMEKMDDIVWSINPKNDSLQNLLMRVKRFAAHLFEATGIDYDIHIQDNIHHLTLPMEHRQHIYLVMKEAINNLVKYSTCTRAQITVRYTVHHLQVTIEDNGRGFDTMAGFTGNGILSMKNRAALMGARLTIESIKDEGTVIRLWVKL